MWNRIIRCLLPPTVRFDSVTMLGGRDAVEGACRLDQQKDGRRRLYIVDADLDFLLGRRAKSLRHLYRLRACTVENLLANVRVVEQLALDLGNFSNLAHARIALDYPNIVTRHERHLRALTAVYAVEQSLNVLGKAPRVGVFQLLHRVGATDELSPAKVYKAIIGVVRPIVKQFGVARFRQEVRRVRERQEKLDLARAVLGKDYVFPLIQKRLTSACGCRLSADQLKVQLSKEIVPAVEPFLARRLRSL